jgi:hypothetical protein
VLQSLNHRANGERLRLAKRYVPTVGDPLPVRLERGAAPEINAQRIVRVPRPEKVGAALPGNLEKGIAGEGVNGLAFDQRPETVPSVDSARYP